MMNKFLPIVFPVALCLSGTAQDTLPRIPFSGMDLTWINGQSRVSDPPLVWKNKQGETLLTGSVYGDVYYSFNFANPIDNTQTISSSIGRHNEVTLNLVSVGIETGYRNMIGRVWLQTGSMLHIVQEQDVSVNKGKNTGTGNLKFIREAAAGYHFDKWHGINVEAGIFMSYIGLESYLLNENWCYQRSMACEFTPFYFQGARVQLYPSRTLKQEIWVLNGWQSYNSYSRSPGAGSSTYYRPKESIQLAANFYVGRDTPMPDTVGNQSNRLRFHHDHSAVIRYYNKPASRKISRAAFSVNNHYGFQKGLDAGDTVTAREHFMIGTSVAHRIWMLRNKLGFSLRGDYLVNGGNYLAFVPSSVAPNDYSDILGSDPYKPLQVFQATATVDFLPNELVTFRIEYGYRQSNLPYFAGSGGTTYPSGWSNGPVPVAQWRPDLRKTENRVTIAISFRL
jgi:hypothetical protein